MRTVSEALGALAHRHGLDAVQLGQLELLTGALAGDERAPTSVHEPLQVVDVHVADSLAGLEVEALCGADRIADLGAGAGLPGLALAIALPRADLRLVESQSRKCDYIAGLVERIALANATVVCARAEEWVEGREQHDAVVARALAAQPVVLEYAAPLLRIGGVLVEWRGRRLAEEEAAAARASRELGLDLVEVRRTTPFEGASDHHLHVFRKTTPTPPRFPRRPGIARKRPLGT